MPKDPADRIDPRNPWTHFREATWEEALDRAAAGLRTVRDRDGGNALAGFGSAKCSNEEAYLFQKLVRTGFGTNNVDHCTRLCHASSVAALMEGIGTGAVTAPFMDALGRRGRHHRRQPDREPPGRRDLLQAGGQARHQARGHGPARHGDEAPRPWMLQFKPGSDVAMLNAIMHVIVDEELYDRQYIQAHTDGFERLKAHLADYPPEAMAPFCGIPAETLREVARAFARAERAWCSGAWASRSTSTAPTMPAA